MSHIFISYSRNDQEYVRQLTDGLRQQNFKVWIDERSIEAGVDWWDSIEKAIMDSSAFIIVMSIAAKNSDWVKREILVAENHKKPIFTLLLEGENWSRFGEKQYIDIRENKLLPNDKFYKRLEEVIPVGEIAYNIKAPPITEPSEVLPSLPAKTPDVLPKQLLEQPVYRSKSSTPSPKSQGFLSVNRQIVTVVFGLSIVGITFGILYAVSGPRIILGIIFSIVAGCILAQIQEFFMAVFTFTVLFAALGGIPIMAILVILTSLGVVSINTIDSIALLVIVAFILATISILSVGHDEVIGGDTHNLGILFVGAGGIIGLFLGAYFVIFPDSILNSLIAGTIIGSISAIVGEYMAHGRLS